MEEISTKFKNRHEMSILFHVIKNMKLVKSRCVNLFENNGIFYLGIGTKQKKVAHILNNQENIGSKKVDVLAKSIKTKYLDVKIETIPNFIDLNVLNSIKDPNNISLCIISADSENVLFDINEYALRTKIPFIPVGYMNDISVIGPFVIPGKTACIECENIYTGNVSHFDLDEENLQSIKKVNENYSAPSSFINNSISSAMAMVDILYFYLDEMTKVNSINKRIGLHNTTFEKQVIHLLNNEKCRCKN